MNPKTLRNLLGAVMALTLTTLTTQTIVHAAPRPYAAAAPQTRTIQLIGGLPFEIALTEDVPVDCKPGQILNFKVTKDVTVGDAVVIAKGAPVKGVVVEAA